MTREEFVQQYVLSNHFTGQHPIDVIAAGIDCWNEMERALAPKEPKPLFENIL